MDDNQSYYGGTTPISSTIESAMFREEPTRMDGFREESTFTDVIREQQEELNNISGSIIVTSPEFPSFVEEYFDGVKIITEKPKKLNLREIYNKVLKNEQ